MRTFVGSDQAYNIVDTTQREDSFMVILKATDATPIFWSQERADLDCNIDAGGNPTAGMRMVNTDPPLVLTGARIVVWARATAPTKVECQVVAQRIAVTTGKAANVRFPGAAPPAKGAHPADISLPGFEDSWTRKGGVQ